MRPYRRFKIQLCRKIKKEDALIDWNDSSENIFNKYRAYHPWPGSCSFFREKRVNFIKFVRCELEPSLSSNLSPGEFVFDKSTKNLYVKTQEGSLIVERLKQEGGKEILGLDFWNGIKEKTGLRFHNN